MKEKEIKYCTGCNSILAENNSCTNPNCFLKKQEIEKQIDKYMLEEFSNIKE